MQKHDGVRTTAAKAGEQGLIEMLLREGFKPEQMYGIDRPERSTAPARTGK